MISTLFGSSPKQTSQTNSTINPTQQGILSQLAQYFSSGSGNTNPTYSQPLTAQITAPQQSTLNAVGGVSNTLTGAASNAAAGLNTAVATNTGVANSSPADFSSYFNNSVVQPLMQAFNTQTIPALQKAFGSSAGATQSSDYVQGVGIATDNLENTIANDASSTALTQYNNDQQNKLTAAGQLNTDTNTGLTGLTTALSDQALPQTTQQATYSNSYQEFLNQLAQNNTTVGQEISTALPSTQETTTTQTSGTSGLLQGLLSGSGGSAIGSGLVSGAESAGSGILDGIAGLAKLA
jgi:hypothetical protein